MIELETKERLIFLSRVVTKEIKHLKYSAKKLFATEFTIEKAESLAHDDELAEQLEVFTSRFCRLQDTVGDKLLPTWLSVLNERTKTAIDNLDKAEKIGVLPSVELWLELRQIRKQMVHEYSEDLTILTNAVQTSYQQLDFIINVAEAIIIDLENRKVISK